MKIKLTEADTDFIRGRIELILGIELLEYHDMNFLSGSNKSRNEAKRDCLLECLSLLGTTAKL